MTIVTFRKKLAGRFLMVAMPFIGLSDIAMAGAAINFWQMLLVRKLGDAGMASLASQAAVDRMLKHGAIDI